MSNLTERAVHRQLNALREANTFELGIRDQSSGKMLIRHTNPLGVMKSVPWLKEQNAKGKDIYIRPDRFSSHPYLLLDDLELASIEDMTTKGFHHVLMLETSPENHQILLRSPIALESDQRKALETAMGNCFGSDLGSCDGQHFFRLAGFTNRKPEHSHYGEFHAPWVKCRTSLPKARLSVAAWDWLESFLSAQTPAKIISHARSTSTVRDNELNGDLVACLINAIGRHLPNCRKNDGTPNQSVADYRACHDLLRVGATSDDLIEALASLSSRKGRWDYDYAVRTVKNVIARYKFKPD